MGVLLDFGGACVVRIPCLRGSYTVPAWFVYRACVVRIPMPAWFVYRACVVRIPCLRGSYTVPIFASDWAACGRPSTSAGSGSARSGRAPGRPTISNAWIAPRADELPQRLGQIFLEVAELLGLAAAELVQVGHGQRVRRGVAGIEAVQP